MKGCANMSALAVDRPSQQAQSHINNLPDVYTVVIRPCTDTDGYYAICDTPDGGCVTQAKSLQETQKSMIEAMEFHLEDYPSKLNYYLSFEVHHASDTSN